MQGITAQSVVQKGDINAPGKNPDVPGKKRLEFGYAQFYAPLKVNEKNDSGTKRGLSGAYAPFSLVFLNQNWEMKKISKSNWGIPRRILPGSNSDIFRLCPVHL